MSIDSQRPNGVSVCPKSLDPDLNAFCQQVAEAVIDVFRVDNSTRLLVSLDGGQVLFFPPEPEFQTIEALVQLEDGKSATTLALVDSDCLETNVNSLARAIAESVDKVMTRSTLARFKCEMLDRPKVVRPNQDFSVRAEATRH